jgi:eukaryotic-like serine/threonine-protein kinase
MMNEIQADRNLMMGMLGLQLGLYTQPQLMAAMRMWAYQKNRLIEDLLVESGALESEKQTLLRKIAQQYLQLHAGNATQGVASLSFYSSVERELRGLDDEELGRTLTIVQSSRRESPASTRDSIGQTTSFVPSHEIGRTPFQRFRVLRPHAKGGLGEVSIAEDRELHREVALKQMQPKYVGDTDARSRFLLEAEVTGRLEHPGIVPVYSLGLNESGNPYYAMRFIKGESLSKAIGKLYRQRGGMTKHEYRLEIRQLIQRLVDVCQAVEYAHSRGVLHRDLKPDNVMLGKYGETLIVDWGLAKIGNQLEEALQAESVFITPSGDSNPQTQMGTIFGTLEYASPEQADGRLDRIGPTSDVYSLGATLYSVLTGQPPVPKLSPEQMLQRVRTGDFSPPRELNADTPRALEAICLKAMSLKPIDRYPSATALASDLELWLAGEPVSAYPEPLQDRATRFARRHRTAVAAGLVGLMTALIGLLVANSITRTQNRLLKEARDEVRIQFGLAMQTAEVASELARDMWNVAEKELSRYDFDDRNREDLRSELTEKARGGFQKLYRLNPSNSTVSLGYGEALRVASNLKRFAGDYQQADEWIEMSVERLLDSPKQEWTAHLVVNLAETYREIGTLAKARGQYSRSIKALAESESWAKAVTKYGASEIDQETIQNTIKLAKAELLEEMDSLSEATELAQRSSDFFLQRIKWGNATIQDEILFLFGRARLIRLLNMQKETLMAEQVATEAVTIGRRLVEMHPKNPNILLPFTRILYWSADGLVGDDSRERVANERITEAIELSKRLSENDPFGNYRRSLGEAYLIQGRLLRAVGQYERAEEALVSAERLFRELLALARNADHTGALARALHEQGILKRQNGQLDTSLRLLKAAIDLQNQALELSPESVEIKKILQNMIKEKSEVERNGFR